MDDAEPPLMQIGQKHRVWVVAIAAAAESLFQAVAGILDGRPDLFLLWMVAYVVILALAGFSERIKAIRGKGMPMGNVWPFVDDKPLIVMRLVMLAGLAFLIVLGTVAFVRF